MLKPVAAAGVFFVVSVVVVFVVAVVVVSVVAIVPVVAVPDVLPFVVSMDFRFLSVIGLAGIICGFAL